MRCFKRCFSSLILLTISILLFSTAGYGQTKGKLLEFDDSKFAPMFPFLVEKGAPDNITNIQTWNGPWKKAGENGFLKVVNGRFTDSTGPRYFFATNLCFSANFPSKEKAERLAATLARFGINVVRLHHMDKSHIWGKNISRTKTEIDPEQLDKLDYLIYQLHEHGIYVNINLHVSRNLDELDGFETSDKVKSFGKGLDNFEPRMIQLQKKYAKDLLTHVNPYTKKAYVNDPGVAMIEINNENSVVASWSWGNLDELPECYKATLRGYWNEWLAKKYPSDTALKSAWHERSEPLGKEYVPEGSFNEKSNFKDFTKNWLILGKEKENFTVQFLNDDSLGSVIMKLNVIKRGESPWIPQFNRQKITAEKGKLYTVTIKARSKDNGRAGAAFCMSHDPWQPIGLHASMNLSPEWKTFSWTFTADADDSLTRFAIDGFEPGKSYEFAGISFKEGGKIGLPEGVSLAAKNIPVPEYKGENKFFLTGTPGADWTAFLKYIEEKYWLDMYHYVKNDLKAQPPVTGTQLQYGFWYAQAKQDYCDIHAYWNHPNFPNKPWDGNDWVIGQEALVNKMTGGSTLTRLASVRVLNRPLTVSEYDHPYPNLYCAEGNLLASAFGAFQDWSVLYQFAWSHSDNYEPQTNSQFFDFCGNQAKLAHAHAAYAMFTRGDVRRGPGRYIYSVPMSENKELEVMENSLTSYHRELKDLNLNPKLSLAVYSGLDLMDLKDHKTAESKKGRVKNISDWKDLPASLGSPEKNLVKNEFKEIFYGCEKDKGYCTVDTVGTKLFTGMIAGRSFNYNGLTIQPGLTRLDWATISVVKTDKSEKENISANGSFLPGRYLVTATGLVMNTGAKIVELPGKRLSLAKNYGGSMGTAPVLCEGIPMTFILKNTAPEKIKVFALDNKGKRSFELKTVQSAEGGSAVAFGPENKTVWYEMIVEN